MAIDILLHRLLVRQEKLEDVDKTYQQAKRAGIIIADHDDHKRAQAGVDKGVIIKIGPSAFKDFGVNSPVKEGDVVAFARYGGKTITDPVDGIDYVALNDEDIIAVIRN